MPQFQPAHLLIEELAAGSTEPNQQLEDRFLVDARDTLNAADRGSFDKMMQYENLIVHAEYVRHDSLPLLGRIVVESSSQAAIRRFAGLWLPRRLLQQSTGFS